MEVTLSLMELLKTGPFPMKLQSDKLLAWTMNCQRAFERLKKLFAEEPIPQHPDPKRQFIIQGDASDMAVAAVLLQRDT